uniref:S phase cyclin A-associated protein in the endoplasmic reticulum-like n=1 Tax=Sinocyclocheilus anshuiensis TaxID=1608454 RepID=A0A671NLR9_9TELE
MVTSFQRSNSHDKVRKIVAEEGRAARNLIAWSVPSSFGQIKVSRPFETCNHISRYWAFLFDNLRRAVDEIYVTCESDQSVVECREVLMMLDNYVRDFKALIDWIQLQEKLEKTDAQNRPTSLAWEVRKMSPGRHVMSSPSSDRIVPSPGVRRALNFGGPPPTLAVARLSHTGPSWADRVKCSQSLPVPTKKDAEGWETVQRGRSLRPRSNTMVAKVSPVLAHVSPKDDSDKENQRIQPSPQEKSQEVREQEQPVSQEQSQETEKTSVIEVLTSTSCCVSLVLFVFLLLSYLPNGLSYRCGKKCCDMNVCVHICVCICVYVAQPPAESIEEPGQMRVFCACCQPQSMAEVLAKKEELADRLEKANEEAIASAIAEEEQLTLEIQAENNELETDNESDFSASIGSGSCGLNLDWSEMLADYDAREPWRQSTSWGDMVEEEPARPPGHGIHMHEKLSSPSRKRTIAESKKKHEEKQLKAQQLRDKLREEKTHKLQKLLEREKEVRKWKEELLDQRRRMMEEKLLHAEFKRELQLQAIVKKAQEEEAKVNEIAFINTLEAQNKRHDVLAKLNEYEQRLNELQEERQRRQEEKQARDEAVQERKRALEAERQVRVEELLMKRREQEARIEQQRQEKERAREDAARERARDREERLAALSAAQQEAMEELQKKIQMKHDESSRRHMEQIEQRKEKAAELSSGRHANTDYAPKLTPYERKKQCSLCNVVVVQDQEHLSHSKHECRDSCKDGQSVFEHLSLKKYIMDIMTDSSVPSDSAKEGEERQKARKKAKKLRARMNSRAKEYETCMEAKTQNPDSPYKAKIQRLVKDLLKQQQGQDSGQWASNKVSGLDRTLGEISRILEKQNNADQVAFQVGGGLSALEQILQVVTAASSPTAVPRIPLKSLCTAMNTYYLSCVHCHNNCSYVLYSNKITFLMDLLLHQLTLFVPDEDNSIFGRSVNKQVFEGLTTGLLQTVAKVLGQLHPPNLDGDAPRICTPDAKSKPSDAFRLVSLSYVVNMGLIDKLYGCFLSIQGPINESPKMAAFLEQATAFLHGMCKLCFAVTGRSLSVFDNKRQDPTGLTALLQSTDLVGVLHMLYCTLLHSALPDSLSAGPVGPQEPYSPAVIQVALQGLRFLNTFALLDLSAFQCVLGAEGLSLAFRHIVSSLLWYCSQHRSEELLHELIICVGYFTVNHPDNQVIVQSGRQPSVLQKLCQLPFQYFSHPRLIKVLFPSLICACYNNLQNKVILQQEMSCVLIDLMLYFLCQDQWDSALQFFLKKQEE